MNEEDYNNKLIWPGGGQIGQVEREAMGRYMESIQAELSRLELQAAKEKAAQDERELDVEVHAAITSIRSEFENRTSQSEH